MKKIFYAIYLVSLGWFNVLSQQTDSYHPGVVIGSFELAGEDITAVYDKVTGCLRKTSPHVKGALIPNENVQIKFSNNESLVQILKPSLDINIYANSNCDNFNFECQNSLCILNNTENNLTIVFSEGDHKIFFNSSRNGLNSIKSNLTIFKNDQLVLPTFYKLDKSNPELYKFTAYRDVVKESNVLLSNQEINITQSEIVLVEKFVKKIKTTHPALFMTDLSKNIYFNVAIIKSTKRAQEISGLECECAPVPLFFKDESPFLCQQDIIYDIPELIIVLNNHIEEFSKNYEDSTINQLKTYLLDRFNLGQNDLSFEQSYFDLFSGISTNNFNLSLEEFIETAWCPFGIQGSDLGCCGNYSGCCWYASAACLLHDIACLNCEPDWFCLSGCVPI